MPCGCQEARRSAQEGGQEIGPAAGLQRRRRIAVRGAKRAVSAAGFDAVGCAKRSVRTFAAPTVRTADRRPSLDRDISGRPCAHHRHQLPLDKFLPPIALRIKQRGQIAVLDPASGAAAATGLGAVGDAEARLPIMARSLAPSPTARVSSHGQPRPARSSRALRAWPRARGSARRPRRSAPAFPISTFARVRLEADRVGDRGR